MTNSIVKSKIDIEIFCQRVAQGDDATVAYGKAGGHGKSTSARNYSSKLKHKHRERINEIAIDTAKEGIYQLIALSAPSFNAIKEALEDPNTKPIDKARLGKDILTNIQEFVPQKKIVQHNHKMEMDVDHYRSLAAKLIAESGTTPRVIDAEVDGQSRVSPPVISGSGEEQG